MTNVADFKPTTDRELAFARLLDAPRAALWRGWTEPELLKQWFCPPPWRVTHAKMDVRSGGKSFVVMTGPNGEQMDLPGIYLDVVPQQRLVFTDAFTETWLPSNKAFMVGTIEMADQDGKTRYQVTVRHWSSEDRQHHEEMGFYTGWGIATDQLEALAKTLA